MEAGETNRIESEWQIDDREGRVQIVRNLKLENDQNSFFSGTRAKLKRSPAKNCLPNFLMECRDRKSDESLSKHRVYEPNDATDDPRFPSSGFCHVNFR